MIRNVTKEIFHLVQTIEKLSDGQAKILDFSEENTLLVAITPTDGLYKNGEFIFRVHVPEKYPLHSPDVTCLTPVYHPNIESAFVFGESEADVCINILDDWQSAFDLELVTQALLFLFYQPNLEDPISPMFEPDMGDDVFAANVKKSLEGAFVEGIEFPRNVQTKHDKSTGETMTAVAIGNIDRDYPKSDFRYLRKQTFAT